MPGQRRSAHRRCRPRSWPSPRCRRRRVAARPDEALLHTCRTTNKKANTGGVEAERRVRPSAFVVGHLRSTPAPTGHSDAKPPAPSAILLTLPSSSSPPPVSAPAHTHTRARSPTLYGLPPPLSSCQCLRFPATIAIATTEAPHDEPHRVCPRFAPPVCFVPSPPPPLPGEAEGKGEFVLRPRGRACTQCLYAMRRVLRSGGASLLLADPPGRGPRRCRCSSATSVVPQRALCEIQTTTRTPPVRFPASRSIAKHDSPKHGPRGGAAAAFSCSSVAPRAAGTHAC